jgi:hypothetical protein
MKIVHLSRRFVERCRRALERRGVAWVDSCSTTPTCRRSGDGCRTNDQRHAIRVAQVQASSPTLSSPTIPVASAALLHDIGSSTRASRVRASGGDRVGRWPAAMADVVAAALDCSAARLVPASPELGSDRIRIVGARGSRGVGGGPSPTRSLGRHRHPGRSCSRWSPPTTTTERLHYFPCRARNPEEP